MVRKKVLRYSILAFAVIAVLAMAGWIGVGVASVAGVKSPPYTVVSTHDGYEIREYSPRLIAEVTVSGDYEDALNRGFRRLADYIFGNNTVGTGAGEASASIAMTAPVLESASIAMTAPVLESGTEGQARRVAFVMPAEYTLDTLPKPRNPEVRIVELPTQRYAAHAFSGWVDGDRAQAEKARLVDRLTKDQRAMAGPPELAQYDPPWTPPFMRRNEILVPLSP